MAVYFVVEIEIRDPETFAQYVERVPATVASHGGRYLVRGGQISALEADWDPERLVIIEFPTREQFDVWAASPEYKEVAKLRAASAKSRSLVVQGV
jgi:uncharacterized protein (DUF1330 family)